MQRLQDIGTSSLVNPFRNKQTKSTSLEACLKLAYSAMNDNQHKILFYISNFPAGAHKKVITDILAEGDTDIEIEIADIHRFSFIEINLDEFQNERYSLLSPVGHFVKDQFLRQSNQDATNLQFDIANVQMLQAVALASQYINSDKGVADVKYGLLRIDQEFPNFLAGFTYAQTRELLSRKNKENPSRYLNLVFGFAQSLKGFCFSRGLLTQGIDFAIKGLQAREELGYNREAAIDFLYLAMMLLRNGNYTELELMMKHLLSLTEKRNDPLLYVAYLKINGDLNNRQLAFKEALEYYSLAGLELEKLVPDLNQLEGTTLRDEIMTSKIGILSDIYSAQGLAYEGINQFQLALETHQKAFSLIVYLNDYLNIGSAFHHLGICLDELGKTSEAIQAYKDAVFTFLQLGHTGFLSNSMGELAHCVLKKNAINEIRDLFKTNLLELSLQDIANEIKQFLHDSWRTAWQDFHIIHFAGALRKCFGIVSLVTLTPQANILSIWANEFEVDIVKIITNEISTQEASDESPRLMLIRVFNLTLAIASTIGTIETSGYPYQDDTIDFLFACCDEMLVLTGDWASKMLQPFSWLKLFLQLKGVDVSRLDR